MANKEIFVTSAYLATKQKSFEKYLLTGKIEREDFSAGFLFYLIELPIHLKSTKASKKIVSLLKTSEFTSDSLEKNFELLLKNLNNSLNEIAKCGDNDWVGSLNSIVGFVQNDQIGITQSGTILGYIFRKGKVSAITETFKQEGPHPLKTYIDFTLGQITPEDKLVFGNREFFDQLSLNYIREVSDSAETKQAAFQFCSNLKKYRCYDANAILISVSDKKSPLEESPEYYYIDEPEESSIEKIAKILGKAYKKSKPLASKLSSYAGKHAWEAISKTKEAWSNDLKPGITKVLRKENQKKMSTNSPVLKNTGVKKAGEIKANNYLAKAKKTSFDFSLILLYLSKLKIVLEPKNRKFLYASLVLLFLIFSFFKLSANNDSKSGEKKEQELVLAFDKAKEKYGQAKEDIALGRAGDQVATLEDALSFSKKAELSRARSAEAKALSQEIQTKLDTLSNASRIFFADQSFPFGSGVKKMILAGQDIYGIDDSGKIYSLNTNDKEVRLVGSVGKDNAELADFSYSENEKKIFLQTKTGKILDFDPTTKTSGEEKAADPGWEQGVAIANYATNIYILDQTTGTIWKHTKKEVNYSKGSTYISAQKADLKDAIDLAVDGKLYVLKSNGSVLKFSQGTAEPFSLKEIKGSNNKLSTPVKIIADADTNYIYILDKNANRIVRYNKSGDFVNQYYLDGANLDDFAINSKIQKMWLLSQGKIFEVKL